MRTKCFSVRLKSLTDISTKAWKATAFDGSTAILPKSQVFGMDYDVKKSDAYLAGVPPLDIMKITGHKSFNSFFKYIRCENMAVALRMHEHDFFKIEL